jgi:hypothetical protein
MDKLNMKVKKQRWKHGLLYCISLSDGKAVLGKVLSDISNIVYCNVYNNSEDLKKHYNTVTKRKPLLYGGLAHNVLKEGYFEAIAYEDVTEQELLSIPPVFRMRTAHPEQCIIVYPATGESRKALPSECIGMDYAFSWEGEGFTKLIEDKLTGRTNIHYELIYKELERGISIEKGSKY